MLLFIDKNRIVDRIIYDSTGFSEEDMNGGFEVEKLPTGLTNLKENEYQELYVDEDGKPYYKAVEFELQPELEYPEVVVPPTDETGRPLTSEERITKLEQEKDFLQLALAESIEKQEIDKLSSQLAIAELTEKLYVEGVLS